MHPRRPTVEDADLIENFFARIKLFRAIATCYEKTAKKFLAAIQR
jgi:transposase